MTLGASKSHLITINHSKISFECMDESGARGGFSERILNNLERVLVPSAVIPGRHAGGFGCFSLSIRTIVSGPASVAQPCPGVLWGGRGHGELYSLVRRGTVLRHCGHLKETDGLVDLLIALHPQAGPGTPSTSGPNFSQVEVSSCFSSLS